VFAWNGAISRDRNGTSGTLSVNWRTRILAVTPSP
jgi:hypothetical protein